MASVTTICARQRIFGPFDSAAARSRTGWPRRQDAPLHRRIMNPFLPSPILGLTTRFPPLRRPVRAGLRRAGVADSVAIVSVGSAPRRAAHFRYGEAPLRPGRAERRVCDGRQRAKGLPETTSALRNHWSATTASAHAGCQAPMTRRNRDQDSGLKAPSTATVP